MNNISRIATQLCALAALVTGWIDPSGGLSTTAQAAITASAAAVVAGVHLADAIENAAHHKTGRVAKK